MAFQTKLDALSRAFVYASNVTAPALRQKRSRRKPIRKRGISETVVPALIKKKHRNRDGNVDPTHAFVLTRQSAVQWRI